MSRDGSGIYHLPSGLYPQAPNTTIESSDWNNLVADLESDANAVRPIVAGGTGGGTAAAARLSLSVPTFGQQITNYAVMPTEQGFVWSDIAATNGPVAAHRFAGEFYNIDANNKFVEVRDIDDTTYPNRKWVRAMVAGVWGAWSAASDGSDKVAKAGDTMTGNLNLTGAQPTVRLNKNALGAGVLQFEQAGSPRWQLYADGTAESGGNAGSNLILGRNNDAGASLGAVISINRATGLITTSGALTAGGVITGTQYNFAGAVIFAAPTGNYTSIYTPDSIQALQLGNASDKASYYQNDAHVFRNRAGATHTTIAPAGITCAASQVINVLNTTPAGSVTSAALILQGGVAAASGWIGVAPTTQQYSFVVGGRSGFGNNMDLLFAHLGGYYGLVIKDVTSGGTGVYEMFLRDDGVGLGSISGNVSGIVYNTTSDARLKENVRAAGDAVDVKAALMGLEVYAYNFIGQSKLEVGLIAQQAYEHIPDMVTPGEEQPRRLKGPDGRDTQNPHAMPWMISYQTAVPYLIAAQQTVWAQLDALTAEVAALKKKLN